MKITGIVTYKFSVPTGQEIRDLHSGELLCSTSKPWLFLKIETDVGIHGPGVHGSGIAPDLIEDLGPTHDLVAVLYQKTEERVLPASKVHRAAGLSRQVLLEVDLDIPETTRFQL